MERLRKAWPQIRAALVAAHLLVIGAVAIPAPVGGGDRRAWKDPSVQEEHAARSARQGIPEPEFEERLFQLSGAWIRGRDWLLQPAFRYVDWTGCDQPWRMFAGPHRYPARFSIEETLEGEAP
ncbi:MAG TPA: hypothetical protein VMV18_14520, partial [bacterium]|nr:hypothetical protein [bacterium]